MVLMSSSDIASNSVIVYRITICGGIGTVQHTAGNVLLASQEGLKVGDFNPLASSTDQHLLNPTISFFAISPRQYS